MDAFAIFDIGTLVNNCDIPQLYPEVVSGDLIHLDLSLVNIIGTENDENGVAPLLPTGKTVNRTLVSINQTYRTIIVSPRKSCSVSIVAGLRVATTFRCHYVFSVQAKKEPTRVVIRGGFVYNETMRATKTISEVLLDAINAELRTIFLSVR